VIYIYIYIYIYQIHHSVLYNSVVTIRTTNINVLPDDEPVRHESCNIVTLIKLCTFVGWKCNKSEML
jgi:hypothetical protein